MANYGIDRDGKVYTIDPDTKLRPWKTCNIHLDLERLRPWDVNDPGLGFSLRNMFKWKGEEMGSYTDCFGGALVNGGLYYRDNDGNFVKLMNVTNIEKTTNLCDTVEARVDIKVDGYPPFKPEKVEVDDSGKRGMKLGTINEKYSLEDHLFFMICEGTTYSIKIERTLVGLSPDYNHPYRVTAYDAGKVLWAKNYQTWRDLECTFMYEVSAALNSWFEWSYIDKIPMFLRDAARVVKYNYINTDLTEQKAIMQVKQLESEKRRDFFNDLLTWQFKNGAKGYLRKDVTIENVIFNDPATIVFWKDGTKTVVHAQNGEPYDKEKGLAMAISKKAFGNKRDYYNTFKRWLRKGWNAPENKEETK